MSIARAFDDDSWNLDGPKTPSVDVAEILGGAMIPFELQDGVAQLLSIGSIYYTVAAVAYLAQTNGQVASNARKWLQMFSKSQRDELRSVWSYHADDASEQRVTRFDYPGAWEREIGELTAIRDLVAAAWGDSEYMDDSLAALLSHW
jgi:hypothetical protein